MRNEPIERSCRAAANSWPGQGFSPVRSLKTRCGADRNKANQTAMTAGLSRVLFGGAVFSAEDNGHFLPRCLAGGRSQTIVGDSSPSCFVQSVSRLSNAQAGVEAAEILSYRYPGCPLMHFQAAPFNWMRRRRLIPNDTLDFAGASPGESEDKPSTAQFDFRVSVVAHWINRLKTPSTKTKGQALIAPFQLRHHRRGLPDKPRRFAPT